jgi:hypothetical protein
MMIRVAALAVVLGVATAASAQPRREGPVEAKYVPPPFFAAVVFEPAWLDKSATAAGLPVGELWKAVEGLAGTDAKKFERVTVLLDPLPGGNVAFMPAFVLRYPAGTDARKQLPALLGGEVKEAKVGDVTYVRSAKYKLAKEEMAGYAIDDRTLLVAPWPTLEPMLKPGGEKDKDRVLGAELAKLDADHDAVVVITPAPGLKRVAEIEKQTGKKTDDPDFAALRPALERVAAITIALDFGKDTLLRAEFRCADAAAATAVHDPLKSAMARTKEAYPEVRKGLGMLFPPEAAKPLTAILDEAVNNHKLTKDGNTVVLTVARPKELAPKK